MLKLLTNPTFWIVLVAVAILILLIVLASKHPEAKVVLAVIFLVVGTGSAIYSGYQIHKYRTAENSHFGSYDGKDYTNQVEADNLTFNFKNIEMVKTSNDNEYSATMSSSEIFKLDDSLNYTIRVNGLPCSNVKVDVLANFVSAEYSYSFYNEEREIEQIDTLYLRLTSYKNSCSFIIRTEGGSSACKLWNSYFFRDDFIITVETVDKVYDPDIDFGEGEVSYAVATFHLKNNVSTTFVCMKNHFVEFPIVNDSSFGGWSLTENGEPTSQYRRLTENTDFYALYDRGSKTDDDYCTMALERMTNGVLDLSLYPIETIPAVHQDQQHALASIFTANEEITSVIFPNTLKTIETASFRACKNLRNVYFATNGILNEIGVSAFAQSGLTKLEIPNSVTTVGRSAFAYCENLRVLVIGKNVRVVEEDLCVGDSNLTAVFIPKTVSYIDVETLSNGDKVGYQAPFINARKVTIYTDAESKQDKWADNFNCNYSVQNDNIHEYAPVVYGISKDKFMERNFNKI